MVDWIRRATSGLEATSASHDSVTLAAVNEFGESPRPRYVNVDTTGLKQLTSLHVRCLHVNLWTGSLDPALRYDRCEAPQYGRRFPADGIRRISVTTCPAVRMLIEPMWRRTLLSRCSMVYARPQSAGRTANFTTRRRMRSPAAARRPSRGDGVGVPPSGRASRRAISAPRRSQWPSHRLLAESAVRHQRLDDGARRCWATRCAQRKAPVALRGRSAQPQCEALASHPFRTDRSCVNGMTSASIPIGTCDVLSLDCASARWAQGLVMSRLTCPCSWPYARRSVAPALIASLSADDDAASPHGSLRAVAGRSRATRGMPWCTSRMVVPRVDPSRDPTRFGDMQLLCGTRRLSGMGSAAAPFAAARHLGRRCARPNSRSRSQSGALPQLPGTYRRPGASGEVLLVVPARTSSSPDALK